MVCVQADDRVGADLDARNLHGLEIVKYAVQLDEVAGPVVGNDILAKAGRKYERVAPVAAIELVVAIARAQDVVPVPAGKSVIAGAAIKHIVASAAVERIVAAPA